MRGPTSPVRVTGPGKLSAKSPGCAPVTPAGVTTRSPTVLRSIIGVYRCHVLSDCLIVNVSIACNESEPRMPVYGFVTFILIDTSLPHMVTGGG